MWIDNRMLWLSVEEADRCWLSPAEVCGLSGLGSDTASDVRRFLNNCSDKGFVPFEKPGSGKTSPKLYSCISAIILRVIWELASTGRTYAFSALIANGTADLTRFLISEFEEIEEIFVKEMIKKYKDKDDREYEENIGKYFIIFSGNSALEGGYSIRCVENKNFNPYNVSFDFYTGVVNACEIIYNVLTRYAEIWTADLKHRGLFYKVMRYSGRDDKGRPLDPDHPSNSDLPPVEKARRLLEIEEFIEAREASERLTE